MNLFLAYKPAGISFGLYRIDGKGIKLIEFCHDINIVWGYFKSPELAKMEAERLSL